MSDIKRKLRQLRGTDEKSESSGSSQIQSKLNRIYQRADNDSDSQAKFFPEESVLRAHKRLDELIPGEYINTPAGDIYRARTTYPSDHIHGNCSLNDLFDVQVDWLLQLGKVETTSLPELSHSLFFDTEASGLSGGTGTYAFLIGMGYFSQDQFVVDQLFVDSYAKEEGMLDLLRDYLETASLLVSFNGKSFDVNLMNTRYAMHGQLSPFEDLLHLDLLHPSRNLWNLTLDNCKLQTLERDILEFHREDDTPGEEVPGIYFDFIRTGDPEEIAGVFEHNVHDIVSLVTVTTVLEQNFHEERSVPTENGLTMFSRAKIYERNNQIRQAITCYEKALENEISRHRRFTILSRLAMLHKRQKEWPDAVNLWKKQIQVMPGFAMEPFEELAKYYEHQLKDLAKALHYTQRAITKLPDHRIDELNALEHRRKRVQKKLEQTH